MKRIALCDLHPAELPAVEVRDLRVDGDEAPILAGVNFSLAQGESLAVVGPNGAGKTTLIKALAGLIKPSAGEIRIFGGPPGKHLCLGYLPQRSEAEWNFPATVLDVVLMGRVGRNGLFRRLTRADRLKAEEALSRVGLSHLSRRRIRELSGGERQRMLIARALAQEARILLLDEPLAGLDAPAQEDILSLLRDLSQQGLLVLVSIHELDLVSNYFDRALLLRNRPVALGRPQEVLTPENLRAAYAKALHLIPTPEGTLALGEACCPGEGREFSRRAP
jgi:manganese/iron transport system ATP-binding protein